MAKTLGITKRIDLSGKADGWDGCYVLTRGLSYGDLKKLRTLDVENLDEDAGNEMMIKLIHEQLVGGNVKVIGDNGELEDAKMEPEFIEQMSLDMIAHIFMEMTGVGAQYVDPKGLNQAASDKSEPSNTSSTSETS